MHSEHSYLAPDLPLKGVGVRRGWGDERTTSARMQFSYERFSTHKHPPQHTHNNTLGIWCKILTSKCYKSL